MTWEELIHPRRTSAYVLNADGSVTNTVWDLGSNTITSSVNDEWRREYTGTWKTYKADEPAALTYTLNYISDKLESFIYPVDWAKKDDTLDSSDITIDDLLSLADEVGNDG